MTVRILLLSVLLVSLSMTVTGQALRYEGEVGATAGLQETQPFWLHANQWGQIDPFSANAYGRLAVRGEQKLSGRLSVGVGADLLARRSAHSTVHFGELYGRLRYGVLQFTVGRARRTIGTDGADDLSSGSLMRSPNAPASPKIEVSTVDYIALPFVGGVAEVKGRWSEGWLGDDRYVDTPLLHQKAAYLRLGGDFPVRIHGGLNHAVLWGGTSPAAGALPSDFADYLTVFYVGKGSEDAPENERVNMLGDHRGMFDLGMDVQTDGLDLRVYHHHFFEDGSGYKGANWRDGIYGVHLSDVPSSAVDRMTYEFAYTMHQSGPFHPPGRDNYYNNGIYRSGWTYEGRVIGSPLMLTQGGPSRLTGSRAVFSNRLVAHHVGLGGQVHSAVQYRVLGTWMRHAGQPYDLFSASQSQYSTLLEVRTRPLDTVPLTVLTAAAADAGDVYGDRVGFRVGLLYQGEL